LRMLSSTIFVLRYITVVLLRLRRRRLALLAAATICASCAARKSAYVFEQRDTGDLLTPPALKKPALVRAVRAANRPACGTDSLRWRGQDAELTLPAGEPSAVEFERLRNVFLALEDDGCLRRGGALRLADAMVERLALPTKAAQELRYGVFRDTGFVHLEPGFRIRIIAPLLKNGGYRLKSVDAAQSGNTIDIRTGEDLIGIERAYWTVAARNEAAGVRIKLESVERTIEGKTAPVSGPVERFLDLPDWAAHVRLFFLTRAARADNDVTVIAARSASLLQSATARFQADPDNYCKHADEGVTCRSVPAGVAVAPMLPVEVNARMWFVAPGSTVREALTVAGMSTAPETLRVWRRFDTRLVPVEPKQTSNLSRMVLVGGERISW
jgi:hypothetical protein